VLGDTLLLKNVLEFHVHPALLQSVWLPYVVHALGVPLQTVMFVTEHEDVVLIVTFSIVSVLAFVILIGLALAVKFIVIFCGYVTLTGVVGKGLVMKRL
jgi:hypothetical protein